MTLRALLSFTLLRSFALLTILTLHLHCIPLEVAQHFGNSVPPRKQEIHHYVENKLIETFIDVAIEEV